MQHASYHHYTSLYIIYSYPVLSRDLAEPRKKISKKLIIIIILLLEKKCLSRE